MTKLDTKWTKKYPKLLPDDRGKTTPQIQASLPSDEARVAEKSSPQVIPQAEPAMTDSISISQKQDQTLVMPPKDTPAVLHSRPPDLSTRMHTRGHAKKPPRFLNLLLQEELVESDSLSDSY